MTQRLRFPPESLPSIFFGEATMQIREIRIKNRLGLHARAATKIVRLASRFRCRVWLLLDGRRANCRNMLAVMMLAATMGSIVRVETNGPDELAAMTAMVQLISERFGEEA
jgi:phosphocarrier protein HPr